MDKSYLVHFITCDNTDKLFDLTDRLHDIASLAHLSYCTVIAVENKLEESYTYLVHLIRYRYVITYYHHNIYIITYKIK